MRVIATILGVIGAIGGNLALWVPELPERLNLMSGALFALCLAIFMLVRNGRQ